MERQLRGVDVLALIFAGVCLVEAGVGLFLQPVYRHMLAEFQTTLPLATAFMLHPATLVVFGLSPMLLVGEGVIRKRSEAAQVARCVVVIVLAVGLVIGFWAAMYLPLTQPAALIR